MSSTQSTSMGSDRKGKEENVTVMCSTEGGGGCMYMYVSLFIRNINVDDTL